MPKLLCALAVLCLAVSVTGSRSEAKPDAGTASVTATDVANAAQTDESDLAGTQKRGGHSYHKRNPPSNKQTKYEEPKYHAETPYSGDKEYDTPPGSESDHSPYYPPTEPGPKGSEYYRGQSPERWGGYDEGPYARPHPRYGLHKHTDYAPDKTPKAYFGYQAVCDDSKGLQVTISPGPWRNGTQTGNLEAASASCATAVQLNQLSAGFTLQVGGYCSVVCRPTANLTVVDNNVTQLGTATGWYSDDTRDASGNQLFGPDLSYDGYEPLRPRLPRNDPLIAQQINFGTYNETNGTPTGVVKMWATMDNRGKASVRFYRPWTANYFDGSLTVAPGTALQTLTAKFRWFSAGPRNAAPAFNMLLRNNGIIPYALSWIRRTGPTANSWNEYSLDMDTDGWRLFCNSFPPPACPGGSGASFTMRGLLADPRFGNILKGADIVGVGFNHGTGAGNSWIGIDWLETSVLNNGNRIDFGPGSEPPQPTLPTVGMGAATIGGSSNGFFASPTGWMFGVGAPEADPPVTAQTSCFGPAITQAASGPIESECANIAFAVCCAPRTAPAAPANP